MAETLLKRKKTCRVCKSKNLAQFLSLGSMPPANAFLAQKDLKRRELSFPLDVCFCGDCSLVQLADVVSPKLLFKNYVYVSSTSESFVAHFRAFAEEVWKKYSLKPDSLVIDVGSNDGILLRPFKALGARVLGVEPATNIAKRANEGGIETIPAFFDLVLARRIVKTKGHASVVTATNVFAHVDDLDGFIEAVKELLSDSGMFIFEVPYLRELIRKNLFDTIYHEHLSYFSVKPLVALFERLGMEIFDVKEVGSHGGSLRVFARMRNSAGPASKIADEYIEREKQEGVHSLAAMKDFAERIAGMKKGLWDILKKIQSGSKKIAGYGAPAKGNTLLNYFGIDHRVLDYIIDDSPWKQGLYTPGTHIPVAAPSRLSEDKPDYLLILAWNFADSIMKKLSSFEPAGGKFVIPVPEPPDRFMNALINEDIGSIVKRISSKAKVLEGKTLVIAGGAGFLGSWIVAVLQHLNKEIFKKPCKVIVLDNYITGSRKNRLVKISDRNISLVEHDVSKPLQLRGPADYILHAAGIASPIHYKSHPIEAIESAIWGAKSLLELAKKKGASSFLFFSSSEIYGDPAAGFIPTPETYHGNVSCIGPRSCYDESKRLGETLCMTYFHRYAIPVRIVRPFNVYGPGMRTDDYRVIPNFLIHALQRKPLPVHSRGDQTRTFCYLTDAITAFFLVLLAAPAGEVYNVGNDQEEITMGELAERTAKLFNPPADVANVEYPDSYPKDEPRRRVPDLSKIKRALGYEAQVNLDAGLRKTLAWFQDSYKPRSRD